MRVRKYTSPPPPPLYGRTEEVVALIFKIPIPVIFARINHPLEKTKNDTSSAYPDPILPRDKMRTKHLAPIMSHERIKKFREAHLCRMKRLKSSGVIHLCRIKGPKSFERPIYVA